MPPGKWRPQWTLTEGQTALLLVLPLLIVTVGLLGYPLFNALVLTFQKKAVGVPGIWVGLANYQQLIFRDPIFPRLVYNTMIYTFGSIAGKTLWAWAWPLS